MTNAARGDTRPPVLGKRNCDTCEQLRFAFVSLNHRPPQTGFADARPGRAAVPSRRRSRRSKSPDVGRRTSDFQITGAEMRRVGTVATERDPPRSATRGGRVMLRHDRRAGKMCVRGRASAPHPANKLRCVRNSANAPFPSSVSETIGTIGVK